MGKMEQNNALHTLIEIADLAKMVEELVSPGNLERLSPAGLSGVRITLRAIRELILDSHDAIVDERSGRQPAPQVNGESPAIVRPPLPEQPRMIKKDLRSTLGQIVERSAS